MTSRQSVEMPTAVLGDGCLVDSVNHLDGKWLEDLSEDDQRMANTLPSFTAFFRPVGNRVTRVRCPLKAEDCSGECFLVVEYVEQTGSEPRAGDLISFVSESSGLETEPIEDVCVQSKDFREEELSGVGTLAEVIGTEAVRAYEKERRETREVLLEQASEDWGNRS
jgi:hypothetical protein